MYAFRYLVFIGRFQPFHLAHYETVKIALQQAEKVIICLGSAQNERSLKNPFLAQERKQMIAANFSQDEKERLNFIDVIDVYNDEKWKKLVFDLVLEITQTCDKVGLIGHLKDESSYYLDIFPEWEQVPLESLVGAISATPLREAFYQGNILEEYLPQATIDFLKIFQASEYYPLLCREFKNNEKA